MRRLLVLLVALLLALFAAPAFAQDDPDDPVSNDDPDVEQVDPDDEDVIPDDPEDDYTDGCDYTSGEGDYQYCGCSFGGTEGDYTYCEDAAGNGGPPPIDKDGGGPGIAPVVQTLSATELPLTGGDPGLVALAGAGLLLAGAGGRRLSRR